MIENHRPAGGNAPLTQILFVCQGGKLEYQSLLLAMSIRKHARFNHRMTAKIPRPAPGIEYPSERTVRLLQDYGVSIDEFDNDLVRQHNSSRLALLLTNKIFCLSTSTDARLTLFLDSDTILKNTLDQKDIFTDHLILRDIGYAGASIISQWLHQLEQVFQFRFPEHQIQLVRPKRPTIHAPQLFNSSLIGIPTERVDSLKTAWLENYSTLWSMALTPPEPYQKEQASFAITVHQSGLEYDTSPGALSMGFDHYSKVLHTKPKVKKTILELLAEQPNVASHFARLPNWKSLLKFEGI